MPSIKEVKNRIGSVKSTQQLTKAMKMVAAAKLKKAQDKVLQLRPYSKKLNEILSNLSGSVNNNLFVEKEVKNVLVVIISSDKGLCGSFNSNLIKQFTLFCDTIKTKNITIAKKIITNLIEKFRNLNINFIYSNNSDFL